MPYSVQPDHCECDWTFHQGRDCDNPPRDTGFIVTSPALCTACLFVCRAEAENGRRPDPDRSRVARA